MYSPIPTLSPVLYYTPTDSYNYMTDNRPIYQLDSNIRAIASALSGLGYGEHASVSGSALSPGSAVELLSNGLIKYPDSTTNAGIDSPAIIGLVIGANGAGLSKVIWGASLLDLSVLGLAGILPNGSTSGQYILASQDSTGSIYLSSSFSSSTQIVLGVIIRDTFISIGKEAVPTMVSDPTPSVNALENYGVTRRRNLYLLQALEATPIQYNKTTLYQDSFATQNPLKIAYSANSGQIAADTTADPVYGTDANNWKLREIYNQFVNTDGSDSVSYVMSSSTSTSTWSSLAYSPTFTNGLQNYDLQSINGSPDFTASGNLPTFKNFEIVKYYQYARITSSSPLYGKVTAIVTVINPTFNGNSYLGGESAMTMVCDFFSYDTSGREVYKSRIVMSGTAAINLYADTTVFRGGITTGV